MGDLKRAWKITRIVSRTDPACIELGTSMGQSECGATDASPVPGGVRQDYAEAFRWFQKGAVANDSDAQTNLGYRYDQGFDCERGPGPHRGAHQVGIYVRRGFGNPERSRSSILLDRLCRTGGRQQGTGTACKTGNCLKSAADCRGTSARAKSAARRRTAILGAGVRTIDHGSGASPVKRKNQDEGGWNGCTPSERTLGNVIGRLCSRSPVNL